MQQLDVYYQHFLNMFRASLCPSSGDQDVCYCTWCAALVLLVVVGSGCRALHTTCSNTRLGLLKMGIMMPGTCWESVDNKQLTVASCWFSLSLHDLLTMHGHRNLKLPTITQWIPINKLTIRTYTLVYYTDMGNTNACKCMRVKQHITFSHSD